MAGAQARLLTYQNKYTFDGVKYAPLMYKIIMCLANINSLATTQMLRDNLQSLGVYGATVSSNIDKVHNKFNKNYSQLIARGATVNASIGILFKAYWFHATTSSHTFAVNTSGKLTAITHEALMMLAKHKFDWLKTKGL
jgi:hypothetical protein